MESTGLAGKIQVSQATADLLVAAGKQEWLCVREDLVEAKGKGHLQTHWVEIKGEGSVISNFLNAPTTKSSISGDTIMNDRFSAPPSRRPVTQVVV
jgi:hypothetical protein